MKHLIPLFLLVHISISAFTQTLTYYVSGNGDNSHDGLSPASAFRNIQTAADLVNPGDTVFIMNGMYTNADSSGNAVTIQRSGTSDFPVTFISFPGHEPLIRFNGWHGILVEGASHIIIEGLSIQGNNDSISLAYAQSQQMNTENPLTGGHGIGIIRNEQDSIFSVDITIRKNRIFDCGGHAIYSLTADWIRIEENEIFDNCWYSPQSPSAISQLRPRSSDGDSRIKMRIERNMIYGNTNLIPQFGVGEILGGHGIFVHNSYPVNISLCQYNGHTLIANNMVFDNGGAALYARESYLIAVIHNTFVQNSAHPDQFVGEILIAENVFVYLRNNIFVHGTAASVIRSINNSYSEANFNLYDSIASNDMPGIDDVFTQDYGFVSLSTDPLTADFRLLPGSPAIDAGFADTLVFNDYFGQPRPLGTANDIGATEYDPSAFVFSASMLPDLYVYYDNQTIVVKSETSLLGIDIYDPQGKLMLCIEDHKSLFIIPAQQWNPGIYFVICQFQEGKALKKIVVY
jgi:hypothetical protein